MSKKQQTLPPDTISGLVKSGPKEAAMTEKQKRSAEVGEAIISLSADVPPWICHACHNPKPLGAVCAACGNPEKKP